MPSVRPYYGLNKGFFGLPPHIFLAHINILPYDGEAGGMLENRGQHQQSTSPSLRGKVASTPHFAHIHATAESSDNASGFAQLFAHPHPVQIQHVLRCQVVKLLGLMLTWINPEDPTSQENLVK